MIFHGHQTETQSKATLYLCLFVPKEENLCTPRTWWHHTETLEFSSSPENRSCQKEKITSVEIKQRDVLGGKFCPSLLKSNEPDFSHDSANEVRSHPWSYPQLSLGSRLESRVADDCDGLKLVFHSLSSLLSLGTTEWERWHFMGALWPRGHG